MNTKTTYRIGAADDSDIVIKQPTVSKTHCELRWTDQGWQLRDLDSTNGTFVDGKRLTEPCFVTGQNQIRLGRDVAVTLPPEPTSKSAATTSIVPSAIDEQEIIASKLPIGIIVAGVGGVASLILLFVAFIVSAGSNKPIDSASVAENNPSGSMGSRSSSTNEPGVNSAVGNDSAAKVMKEETASSQAMVASPYWAIIIESADGKSQRLLGTAVAIESNRLLALASIAEAIEEVKDAFPTMILTQAQQPNVRIKPSQILIHPNFKKALVQVAEFETQLNEKIKGVESMAEPTVEESLDWSGKLEDILYSLSKSDVACITTDARLDKFLPLAANSKSENVAIHDLFGYPMIVPSPVITNNLSNYYLEGKASLRLDTQAKNPVLFAETRDLAGIPLVSMICVDSQSQVIGLCVKEEPVQGVGDPQRCQISSIEVFWK